MDDAHPAIDRRKTLGYRYLLTERIGEGAVASVWKAFDLVGDRLVAVKVLKDVFDPEDAARLQMEIGIVSRLQHPNIIRFLDHGVTDRGRWYVVMELLEGESLRDLLLRDKRLDYARAAPILGQAASALAEAHRHKVVHRDFKPENIFLVRTSSYSPKVKLLDFGMAKVLGGGNPNITWGGNLFGTPHYMAPERIKGEEASPASDVYALAVVAYEVLSGKRPFEGRTPEDVMKAHLLDDPEPLPSDVELPERVRRLIEAGMSRTPEDRPSARDFQQALTQ